MFEQVGGGVESDSASGGAARESYDLIGGTGRELILFQRIEQDVGGAVEDAGIGGVDQVSKIDGPLLHDREDGTVVGEVTFDMPVAGDVVRRLGSGAEIDVGGADPDVGSAVELASLVDGEVGFENDFGPRAWTSSGSST